MHAAGAEVVATHNLLQEETDADECSRFLASLNSGLFLKSDRLPATQFSLTDVFIGGFEYRREAFLSLEPCWPSAELTPRFHALAKQLREGRQPLSPADETDVYMCLFAALCSQPAVRQYYHKAAAAVGRGLMFNVFIRELEDQMSVLMLRTTRPERRRREFVYPTTDDFVVHMLLVYTMLL
jgi:hypothetical protein